MLWRLEIEDEVPIVEVVGKMDGWFWGNAHE